MINEIKYAGYSAQPSDYLSSDGELALSLNLINENGSITPVALPQASLSLQQDESLAIIHAVGNQKNYILLRDIYDAEESKGVYWVEQSENLENTDSATFISVIHGLSKVAIMGNTLVFTSESGPQYILWKNGSYIHLGSRPPFLTIDFGMKKRGTLDNFESFIDIAETCVGSGQSGASAAHRHQTTKEDLADLTQRIYAQLLSAVADKVISNGYFYQPFFIRYAYRLFDGSYAWHSAPVLMLPTATVPCIKVTSNDAGTQAAKRTVGSKLDVPYFELNYLIPTQEIDKIKHWEDIIAAVDIFVSAPIYTFDQSKDLKTGLTSCLDLYKSNQNVAVSGSNNSNRGRAANDIFIGHFADIGDSSRYIDHNIAPDSISGDCWAIQWHERFLENLKSVHDFYKIAEIEISDIKISETMTPLSLSSTDLTNLVTRPTLPDDYISHATLRPDILHTFNARLNMAGVIFSPPKPLPYRSCVEYSNTEGSNSDYTITVWSRHNGVACHTVHSSSLNADKFNIATGCPRYIYYPDATAFKMEIYISDTEKYTIPLTAHDFLNGAYYFGGILADRTPEESTEQTPANAVESVPMPSKIYTSEVNNPFIFPAVNINTVGSGDIMALSSAAKALSQGQFGQFPLYAFTSEGVWALEIASNGSFIARQPITRDVLIDPQSIVQLDSSVLFATRRGFMLLSGSDTACISDSINTDTPFKILSLPNIESVYARLGLKACDTKAFSKFINGCRFIYDYTHQRITAFNPDIPYAYIYSLRTNLWASIQSKISYTVNSYPNAVAVTNDKQLVDFSLKSSIPKGLLITRPLKLDAHDILKTVNTIIQRGNFRKGHVQSVLYGSRDLENWHLVWSSKDHYLRGFRGTPYKYFRIALLCNLADDESIYGATVQYDTRKTNQPR